MKRILLFLFIFSSVQLFAQITFRTGDSGLDAELTIMNKDANNDLKTFKSTLVSDTKLSLDKIDGFLKIMEPAEVWLASKIATITNVSVDKVVKSYEVNKDKGWGAIAKDMGIKPGSAEFHELKNMTKNKNSKSAGKGNSHSNGKGNSGGKGKK